MYPIWKHEREHRLAGIALSCSVLPREAQQEQRSPLANSCERGRAQEQESLGLLATLGSSTMLPVWAHWNRFAQFSDLLGSKDLSENPKNNSN